MKIAAATQADSADWAALRQALWPNGNIARHAADIAALLDAPEDTINLIARLADGRAVGLAEASLRHDYVNGCKTSPVAFLEGIYVAPDHRRRGIAGQLVARVEDWARSHGCTEFASDTGLDNLASQQMHGALGFSETQRVVFFRKVLGKP
ncbi:MAG: aminoglycoside 6'-acetyltransferase [Pelagibacterium sp. SCN 64-44]|nr:MAG: aminoglycoside 6'-acetyltransferase [Pelagibacterium sp. SCN 64-44]